MTRSLPALLLVAALGAPPAGAQTWRELSAARQHRGERSLSVRVDYAVGAFDLRPAPPATLYRMELRYDEDRFLPVRRFDEDGARLEVGVRSRGAHVERRDRKRSDPPPSLDLSLSPDVALDLDLELGAVRSQVDLGGLLVTSLRYRTGASETYLRFSRPNEADCDELVLEAGAAAFRAAGLGNSNCRRLRFDGGVGDVRLDFSGAWERSMEADVEVALGSLTLVLPRGLGVAVRVSRLLASFERSGFVRRGDAWVSPDYDSARRRLDLDVRAVFGGVSVVWAPAGR